MEIDIREDQVRCEREASSLDPEDLREGFEEAQRLIREDDRAGLLDYLERSRDERIDAAMCAAGRA